MNDKTDDNNQASYQDRAEHQRNNFVIGIGLLLIHFFGLSRIYAHTIWIIVIPIMIGFFTARHALLWRDYSHWPNRYRNDTGLTLYRLLQNGALVKADRIPQDNNAQAMLLAMIKDGFVLQSSMGYRIKPGKRNDLLDLVKRT